MKRYGVGSIDKNVYIGKTNYTIKDVKRYFSEHTCRNISLDMMDKLLYSDLTDSPHYAMLLTIYNTILSLKFYRYFDPAIIMMGGGFDKKDIEPNDDKMIVKSVYILYRNLLDDIEKTIDFAAKVSPDTAGGATISDPYQIRMTSMKKFYESNWKAFVETLKDRINSINLLDKSYFFGKTEAEINLVLGKLTAQFCFTHIACDPGTGDITDSEKFITNALLETEDIDKYLKIHDTLANSSGAIDMLTYSKMPITMYFSYLITYNLQLSNLHNLNFDDFYKTYHNSAMYRAFVGTLNDPITNNEISSNESKHHRRIEYFRTSDIDNKVLTNIIKGYKAQDKDKYVSPEEDYVLMATNIYATPEYFTTVSNDEIDANSDNYYNEYRLKKRTYRLETLTPSMADFHHLFYLHQLNTFCRNPPINHTKIDEAIDNIYNSYTEDERLPNAFFGAFDPRLWQTYDMDLTIIEQGDEDRNNYLLKNRNR